MVRIGNQLYVASRDHWRAWLQENHGTEKEIWLLHYKKHTAKPSISYEEAVEEALCFGWIDSIMKSLDGEKYALRYSPRKRSSIWSEANKRRVEKMISQGLMTEAGLAKIREAKASGEWQKATVREDTTNIPPDLEEALRANAKARLNFESLAPSYKKQFIWWITSAKTQETRQRRVLETVRLAEENKKPGMK
jgi:uncharacterized protein YdeI (YjbR/CyaY-like superfamily)